MTHNNLVSIAEKWLLRSLHANGAGCNIALTECKTGHKGEVPDAIGFTSKPYSTTLNGSILIEVKTSRADFLGDKHKPHRKDPNQGTGNYRYYLTPKNLISLDELPPKWGLIEVSQSGRISILAGLHYNIKNNDNQQSLESISQQWRFNNINEEGEKHLLIRALANTEATTYIERERKYNRIIRNLEKERTTIIQSLFASENNKIKEQYYYSINDIMISIEQLKQKNNITPTITPIPRKLT